MEITTNISREQLAEATAWWAQCSDAWKRAFNEVALQRNSTEQLPDDMLLTVFTSPNHRFSGPEAPYPNMSFQLDDLSGLTGLPNVEVLVVTFQQLRHIREVAAMKNMYALFVYDNHITSLEGIEDLVNLQELHFQQNEVTSLLPVEKLVNLKTLYCTNNLINSLEGVGPQHTDILENFYCLPNPNLKNSTVLSFEREMGIRCRKG